MSIYTLLLLSVKFGVWCAVNATGQLFESHKFIPLCYTYSDPSFFITSPISGEPTAFFQQNSERDKRYPQNKQRTLIFVYTCINLKFQKRSKCLKL